MACITEISTGYPGYNGRVPLTHGLLSEMLTPFGWAAFAIGKWHLTPLEDMSLASNRKWWPLGRGFDRYYGFLGGDTDQYYPWLTYDNHFIKPPATPEEGYHNVPDLTNKAKEFIADLKQVAPDRPFFLYYCPGAVTLRTMFPKIGSPSTKAPSTAVGTSIARRPWPIRSKWVSVRRAPSYRRPIRWLRRGPS